MAGWQVDAYWSGGNTQPSDGHPPRRWNVCAKVVTGASNTTKAKAQNWETFMLIFNIVYQNNKTTQHNRETSHPGNVDLLSPRQAAR